ncbi:MAG TPA: family 43 glycosylhydrolase [Polyangiaceae bacterium]|nr:family 43 glycosylhydrolase [Polyangiaceae bacterium]
MSLRSALMLPPSRALLACSVAMTMFMGAGCGADDEGVSPSDPADAAAPEASQPKPDTGAPPADASGDEGNVSVPDADAEGGKPPVSDSGDAEGGAPKPAWHTPLVLPNSGSDTADPHCILVDGTWYLYPTSSQKDLDVWTSTDLVEWTYRGVAWQPTVGTWNDVTNTGDFGAWAPSVHKGDDGAFYMYYTAGARVGVARSATPLGPFVEELDHPLLGDGHGGVGDGVQVGSSSTDLLNYQEFSIDAFVLRTSQGKRFLYATMYVPMSVIAVWPMTSMTELGAATPTVIGGPNFAWESAIMEGPFVVERNGRFILTYSGNAFATTAYALGAAVSDDPMGPFTKDVGNPFFASNDGLGIWGPGHHSFVDDGSGGTLMFYHAKGSPNDGADRHVRIAPVVFADAPPVTVLYP